MLCPQADVVAAVQEAGQLLDKVVEQFPVFLLRRGGDRPLALPEREQGDRRQRGEPVAPLEILSLEVAVHPVRSQPLEDGQEPGALVLLVSNALALLEHGPVQARTDSVGLGDKPLQGRLRLVMSGRQVDEAVAFAPAGAVQLGRQQGLHLLDERRRVDRVDVAVATVIERLVLVGVVIAILRRYLQAPLGELAEVVHEGRERNFQSGLLHELCSRGRGCAVISERLSVNGRQQKWPSPKTVCLPRLIRPA